MPKSIDRTLHHPAKDITDADIDAYIESLGGLDEDGNLPEPFRSELYTTLDKLGLQRPTLLPKKRN